MYMPVVIFVSVVAWGGASLGQESESVQSDGAAEGRFAEWFNRKYADSILGGVANAPTDIAADTSLSRLSDGNTVRLRVDGNLLSISAERAKELMLAELKKKMRQQLNERRERQDTTDLRAVSVTARPTASPTELPTSNPFFLLSLRADMDAQDPRAFSVTARPSAFPTEMPTSDPLYVSTGYVYAHAVSRRPTELPTSSPAYSLRSMRDPNELSISSSIPTDMPSGTPRSLAHEMRASGWGRGANEWVREDKTFRVYGLAPAAKISSSERARLGLAPIAAADWERPVSVSQQDKVALGLNMDDADLPVWSRVQPQLAAADRRPFVGKDDVKARFPDSKDFGVGVEPLPSQGRLDGLYTTEELYADAGHRALEIVDSDRDYIAPNPADPADVGGLNLPRGQELPLEDRGGPMDEWSGDWTGKGGKRPKLPREEATASPNHNPAPAKVSSSKETATNAVKGVVSKMEPSRSNAFGIGIEPLPAGSSSKPKAELTKKAFGIGLEPLPA